MPRATERVEVGLAELGGGGGGECPSSLGRRDLLPLLSCKP